MNARKSAFLLAVIALAMVFSCGSAAGFDLVYFHLAGSDKQKAARELVEEACEIYGLDFLPVALERGEDRIVQVLQRRAGGVPFGVVIHAAALNLVSVAERRTLGGIGSSGAEGLLILDIDSTTNLQELGFQGALKSQDNFLSARNRDPLYLQVDAGQEIAGEIAGHRLYVGARGVLGTTSIEPKEATSVEVLAKLVHEHGDETCPVFARTLVGVNKYIYLSSDVAFRSPGEPGERDAFRQRHFFRMSPLLFFIRAIAGKAAWHATRDYANLTVDDPKLTEPYGQLSYMRLLQDMKERNYHTTIAFIPWNYDRNDAEITNLFVENPKYLSISVHGNNHDRREFFRYASEGEDRYAARPLVEQEEDVAESVVRMEEFSRRTGVPHDRVMVFPHGIAPAKTLELLKKYNYVATFNLANTPLDVNDPGASLPDLRAVTTQFYNFPSVRRYPPLKFESDGRSPYQERLRTQILIDLFLDNPVAFYTHHDFFDVRSDTFGLSADYVNSLNPEVEWASLGELTRHLYRLRQRQDGGYDVWSWSNDIVVENESGVSRQCKVAKREDWGDRVGTVSLDGVPWPYIVSKEVLSMEFTVEAHESKHVRIMYDTSNNVQWSNASGGGVSVALIRFASELRDNVLFRIPGCAWLLKRYYASRASRSAQLYFALLTGGVILVAAVVISLPMRTLIRKRRSKCCTLH